MLSTKTCTHAHILSQKSDLPVNVGSQNQSLEISVFNFARCSTLWIWSGRVNIIRALRPHTAQGVVCPFSRRSDKKAAHLNSAWKIFHFMRRASCQQNAKPFIGVNLLQTPGQWVIMSTSIAYLKAFLQSFHYLNNTMMTFILQRGKAMLGSSRGWQSKARQRSVLCRQVRVHRFGWAMWVVNWKALLGHREMKSCRQLLPASGTNRLEGIRELMPDRVRADLQEKIIPPTYTSSLALGVPVPQRATWHCVVLSQLHSCNAVSYCFCRMPFPCYWHRSPKEGVPQPGREARRVALD